MPASVKHLTDKKLNLTSLLARWKDGLYYTAAIVKCDKLNKKCLVCFEDGSEVWINNRDVHIQLTLDQLGEDEDIVCCICDDGRSEPPNEIILCDVCQQGYHQKCHNPPVDSSKIDESDETDDHKDWFCATCSYILNQSDRAKLSTTTQQQQKQTKQVQFTAKQQANQTKTPTNQETSKQPPKVKHTPVVQQQKSPAEPKNSVGPVKPSMNSQHRQQPYNPLSNQVRIAATSSTAALASMTASSALVVGGSTGRSKQDLVNQSNKSSQRQRQTVVSTIETIKPPIKHAVRKSSINFVSSTPKQSALPTAIRTPLPNMAPPLTKTSSSSHSPSVKASNPLATPASSTVSAASTPAKTSIIQGGSSSMAPISHDKVDGNTIVGNKASLTQSANSSVRQSTATAPQISVFSKLVNWTGEPQVTVAPSSMMIGSTPIVKAATINIQSANTGAGSKEAQKGPNVRGDCPGEVSATHEMGDSNSKTSNNGDNISVL